MPSTMDFEALTNAEEANKTKQRILQLSENYSIVLGSSNAGCLETKYDVQLAKQKRVNMNDGRAMIPESALEVLDICDSDMFLRFIL